MIFTHGKETIMRKQLIASLVSLSLVTSSVLVSPVAHASGAVAGATEITQLLNNAELVTQVAQQAQQLATELQQYQTMIQNLQNIPNQVWSSVQNDLVQLAQVANTGQALSFAASNIAQQFEAAYPGYATQSVKFATAYKGWSQKSLDSIKGALSAAGKQYADFANEAAVLNSLRTMSQSSSGQLQALQTGTQIAVEQAAQLQKLRGLIMAQMQSQANYQAAQQAEKDASRAAADKALQYVDPRAGVSFKGFSGGSK